MKFFDNKMEVALQNGIRETKSICGKRDGRVNNTIENGVKDTHFNFQSGLIQVEDVIQNGVRYVEDGDWLDNDERLDEIIKNGVKETKHRLIESYEQKDHQVTTLEISQNIKNAIENGVKE
jgi:hypothetical protein